VPLRDLLRLDPDAAQPVITEINALTKAEQTLFLCVDGNETPGWQEEKEFLKALGERGDAVVVVEPRGVGKQRPKLTVRNRDYADPLVGVEENIAYNAFLVGKSLLGMRVADVLAALTKLTAKMKSRRIVLCGRRDAALVACFAAAVEAKIDRVAAEEMWLSFLPLFAAEGRPINAASLLPGLLRNFGDLPDVLAQIAPRRVLMAAGIGESPRAQPSIHLTKEAFTKDVKGFSDWLRE
jgi:hypothetical protein